MSGLGLRGLLLAAALWSAGCPLARAAEPSERKWAGRDAVPLRKNQVELGTFSLSKWGMSDRFELGVHPILTFIAPHVEVKAAWWSEPRVRDAPWRRRGWALASLFSLGYPTQFLSIVSRRGSLGLLPDDTQVPPALEWGTGLVLSRYERHSVFSVRADIAFAPHAEADVPLLDFPFLYQRFASFYAPVVPRLGAFVSGELSEAWGYDLESVFSYLPIDPELGVRRAYALESAVTLRCTFLSRHRLAAGLRVSTAEYPVGIRTYYLPTIDYRWALF